MANLFRTLRRSDPGKAGSTGGRDIYAIGDVHGCLDLLDGLLQQIRSDAFSTGRATRPVLIFLGDYVDRGPDSKGVIDCVLAIEREGAFELRGLKGNHEEALLAFLDDASFGPAWCENGGGQTLLSYGVSPPRLRTEPDRWSKARDDFAQALPREHLRFLSALELSVVYGDYAFVHAGVRPGVPLSAQREADLLWIRRDFLEARGPFEKIVVHGHSPAEEAFLGPHRIGVDTGAYATGVLTAVRLRDGDRRLFQASARPR